MICGKNLLNSVSGSSEEVKRCERFTDKLTDKRTLEKSDQKNSLELSVQIT